MRSIAIVLAFLAIPATASADVVFLKGGQRLEGELQPKGNGYEIRNEFGSWILAKEDVARIVPAFAKLMSDGELFHAQARALYEEALTIENDPRASNARLRAGVELLRKVADLYNEAIEVYTDPKYGDLSKPLTRLFQEMRLYRDKMHSEAAPSSAPSAGAPEGKPPAPAPVPAPPSPSRPDPAALLAKAVSGDLQAQYALGVHWDDREWASAEGLKWLRAAAQAEHARAQYRLGRLSFLGKGVKQDFREAERWYLKAQGAGVALAYHGLAVLEWKGCLASRNLEKAWAWGEKGAHALEEQARQDDPEAVLALAWMYQEGLGRILDKSRALELYRRAADLGCVAAHYFLGAGYRAGAFGEPDRVEAEREFLRAAELGHAEAQVVLGELHDEFTGARNPGTKDFTRAREWYQKAADQGHGRAFYRLGLMQLDGKGVAKNPAEAARWFQAALRTPADDFLAALLNDLGFLHERGLGVKKDLPESLKHYRSAAELGSLDAQYNLGSISLEKKNDRDALKWFLTAARKGHAQAQNNLGTFYATGRSVRKSLDEAEKWFLMAAQQGDQPAAENLKRLQKERGLKRP